MLKYRRPYLLNVPVSGIRLTSGRLKKAFDDNLSFLKGFDPDRMLYWYRVHAGRPAPGAPYACGDGHFENNLHGQTVGEFLMGAGTSLMWTEDPALRAEVRAVLDEVHQSFVPGRSCEFRDVCIDFAGVLLGAAFLLLIFSCIQRKKLKR